MNVSAVSGCLDKQLSQMDTSLRAHLCEDVRTHVDSIIMYSKLSIDSYWESLSPEEKKQSAIVIFERIKEQCFGKNSLIPTVPASIE